MSKFEIFLPNQSTFDYASNDTNFKVELQSNEKLKLYMMKQLFVTIEDALSYY